MTEFSHRTLVLGSRSGTH